MRIMSSKTPFCSVDSSKFSNSCYMLTWAYHDPISVQRNSYITMTAKKLSERLRNTLLQDIATKGVYLPSQQNGVFIDV